MYGDEQGCLEGGRRGSRAKGQEQERAAARRTIKVERKRKKIKGGNTPVAPNTRGLCGIFCFTLWLLFWAS